VFYNQSSENWWILDCVCILVIILKRKEGRNTFNVSGLSSRILMAFALDSWGNKATEIYQPRFLSIIP
jgi:hypothetical protein